MIHWPGEPNPLDPPADVEERLSRELNVWLCTVRRDGSPHLTPVWFVYLAATFWVGCESRSVKARNVVADHGCPWLWRAATRRSWRRAPPTCTEVDSRAPVVEAFARKYDGWDVGRQVDPDSERALLEIPVRRWLLAGTAQ